MTKEIDLGLNISKVFNNSLVLKNADPQEKRKYLPALYVKHLEKSV